MKCIINVFWVTLFLCTFSDLAIAKFEKLDESQWRESVNNRISEVTQSCHKTKEYQLYVLAGKVQEDCTSSDLI